VLLALATLRAEALAAVVAAERDFRRIVEASRSVATDDEHDPEGAGLAVERAQIVALLERARAQLEDVELATEELAAGRYGTCRVCHRPIGSDRLAARPAARTCITCANDATGRGR
jgi:DnaK suppressor protein